MGPESLRERPGGGYGGLPGAGQYLKRSATSQVMSDEAAMALILMCAVLTAMVKHWL